ncbi:myeloperoxidase-like [Aphis gossypii]|uniref:myeloperoxidase-like n=1 Tax=Aphis gossypii TaxID=80765 RepID=UPI0021596785|nr:myeloperoxidase-like [Aphis gossypii]
MVKIKKCGALCIRYTVYINCHIYVLFLIFNKPTMKTSTLKLNSMATINNDYFEKCAPRITCDPNAKYRTINGSCNNLQNPSWGEALTPFYRYMNPMFSDGISDFLLQSDGSPLPNARNLILRIFKDTRVGLVVMKTMNSWYHGPNLSPTMWLILHCPRTLPRQESTSRM